MCLFGVHFLVIHGFLFSIVCCHITLANSKIKIAYLSHSFQSKTHNQTTMSTKTARQDKLNKFNPSNPSDFQLQQLPKQSNTKNNKNKKIENYLSIPPKILQIKQENVKNTNSNKNSNNNILELENGTRKPNQVSPSNSQSSRPEPHPDPSPNTTRDFNKDENFNQKMKFYELFLNIFTKSL